MSVLDDASQAGEAANAAFLANTLSAYLRSSALVLLGKDVAIPLVVSCLPRLEDLKSARMRQIVAKLGGTHYHDHQMHW